MAFIDSTSDQRVELLRQAEKTANLTRRVTVGSGVLGASEGVEGDALCSSLSGALTDMGYSSLPSDGAVVSGGDITPVLRMDGTTLVNGTALVEDNVFEGVELPAGASVVQNAAVVQVRTTSNTTPTPTNATAQVQNGILNRVTLQSTEVTLLPSGTEVPIRNSQGTTVGLSGIAFVNSGVVQGVTLPPSTAPVVSGTRPVIQNSSASVTVNGSVPTITNGAIANIKLPATHAIVTTGSYTTIPVTGEFTTTVEFTVSNGVITGIALS